MNDKKTARLFAKEEILTIPNFLSMFRLGLAVLIPGIAQKPGGMEENRELLAAILALSAVTDFLDGKIARKFHMVSEVGKILDPVADKVTQGVLLLCLIPKYSLVKGVLALFLVKESFMAIVGARTICRTKKNEGALWYGKASTAVFYAVMILLIFFIHIPKMAADILIICCGCWILAAFLMYAHHFHMQRKETE